MADVHGLGLASEVNFANENLIRRHRHSRRRTRLKAAAVAVHSSLTHAQKKENSH